MESKSFTVREEGEDYKIFVIMEKDLTKYPCPYDNDLRERLHHPQREEAIAESWCWSLGAVGVAEVEIFPHEVYIKVFPETAKWEEIEKVLQELIDKIPD